MVFNGICRNSMVFNGIRRDLMVFNGIHWNLMVFNGIRRDLVSLIINAKMSKYLNGKDARINRIGYFAFNLFF